MKTNLINKTLKYLAWLLVPLFMCINKHYVRKVYGSTEGYDRSLAYSLDCWGNKEFRTGLNSLMLTPESKHHFGNINESISSVFGKNKRDGTLSKRGVSWANRLDKIDTNHCLKSINNEVSYQDKDFELIMNKNYKS
ncbi:hypothetical protein [Ornithobacterium rhinotracheale]|uniref:hypothetical protein n=1 Tax=Ornithobacterium rhinotracheale TaxID=28251 RepID=UPI004035DD70